MGGNLAVPWYGAEVNGGGVSKEEEGGRKKKSLCLVAMREGYISIVLQMLREG